MTKSLFLNVATHCTETIIYDSTIGGSELVLEVTPYTKEMRWKVYDGDHETDFGDDYAAAADWFYN